MVFLTNVRRGVVPTSQWIPAASAFWWAASEGTSPCLHRRQQRWAASTSSCPNVGPSTELAHINGSLHDCTLAHCQAIAAASSRHHHTSPLSHRTAPHPSTAAPSQRCTAAAYAASPGSLAHTSAPLARSLVGPQPRSPHLAAFHPSLSPSLLQPRTSASFTTSAAAAASDTSSERPLSGVDETMKELIASVRKVLSKEESELVDHVEEDEVRRLSAFVLGASRTATREAFRETLEIGGQSGVQEMLDLLNELVSRSKDGPWPLSYEGLIADKDAQEHFVAAVLQIKLEEEGSKGTVSPGSAGAFHDILRNPAGTTTMQEFALMDTIILQSLQTECPISYTAIAADGGRDVLVRSILHCSMVGVSEDMKAEVLAITNAEAGLRAELLPNQSPDNLNVSADSLFLFLTEHLSMLQACPLQGRDSMLRGLLDVYTLQRQPVVREFESPSEGELPPQIAHSPMKPLGQEISHRTGLLINLFPPQRVAWGAFVDLSKVVRPLRAKNYVKKLKYHDREDIYYKEP